MGVGRVVLVIICSLMGWTQAGYAQEYPNHPVKLIVPFGAGGPSDLFVRALAEHLSKVLGQPFIVENRPGADSIIGTQLAAAAQGDGYTLLVISNAHTINETLVASKGYELMRSFRAIAPIFFSDLALLVHPSVGARSVRDLIASAARAPGSLNYGSSATPYTLATELFKAKTNTNIVRVPFRNSAEARNSMLGGHIQVLFDTVSGMSGAVALGQVDALATTGLRRAILLPKVPTLNDEGVAGYQFRIWLGLMAPGSTPDPIIDRLSSHVTAFLGSANIQESWAKQGADIQLMTSSQFSDFLRRDIESSATVLKQAGLTEGP